MSGSFREGSSLFIDVSEGSNIVHRGKLSELYRSSIISPAATAVAAASMATAAGPSPTPGNNGVLYGSTAGCLTPSNVAAPLSIPPAGSTVSATPMARMKTYATSNVAQQTRHARRIYCGGIPPNFTDEDGLRNFINVVIAQGLGEENDHSYVLSVYINHKKCFAFVELKSIELATACLELDGIIFRNIVLRILRANEYKPELVVAHQTKNIHFDTSGFQFGTPNATSHYNAADVEDAMADRERSLDSIIDCSSLSVEADCIALLGFPFDDSSKRGTCRGMGCANAPKSLRGSFRKYKYGSLDNPEFAADLSHVRVVDVGDVLSGKCMDETYDNLSWAVSQLLLRRAVPFVFGGSNDLIYHSAAGLSSICAPKVASVVISAQLDTRLLDLPRFCGGDSDSSASSCEGRLVHFATQGSHCCSRDAHLITSRGGKILWLQKEIRSQSASQPVSKQFQNVLEQLANSSAEHEFTPVVVTLDAGVLSSELSPTANSSHSPSGLSLEEASEIMRVCGASTNVVAFNLTEFSPQADDSRLNLVLTDLFYQFVMGFTSRPASDARIRFLPSSTTALLESYVTAQVGSPSDRRGIELPS